jgi:hypothetical protein
MGWGLGWDDNWSRDVGYLVPAYCDHPGCNAEIDRGLAYVCAEQEIYGGKGCGLHFCEHHRHSTRRRYGFCSRCANSRPPFDPKPDHPRWAYHKLHDHSWAEWRNENPREVERMRAAIGSYAPPADDHGTNETDPGDDEIIVSGRFPGAREP